MKVVGLDLSLTSTGVAVAVDGTAVTETLTTTGKADATLAQRRTRLSHIAARVVGYCVAADLVVIEQPAYSRTVGAQHDRSGLWWLVVNALHARDLPVAEVAPSTLKKYATGVGNADKDRVLAAVLRRYPDVDVEGRDQADALILACMGARWAGHPLEDRLPLIQTETLAAVRWPLTGVSA